MNASKAKRERKSYSEDFKAEAVQKALSRGTRSVREIADEVGVNPSVLQHWLNRHMERQRKPDAPQRGPGRPHHALAPRGEQITMVLPAQESANSAALRDRCRDLENENARLRRALQALLGTDPITGH